MPLGEHGLVPQRDVQQDQRAGPAERRDQERVRRKFVRLPGWAGLDQRVEVVVEMDVVGGVGRQAALGDAATLHAPVAGHGLGACPPEHFETGRGDRLSGHGEPSAAEINPGAHRHLA